MSSKPKVYREIIDELVDVCHHGQGQIGSNRARAGLWNQNATPNYLPDQHRINALLHRLAPPERETLAQMLAEAFEGGVFETLKALESFEIAPFVGGYEGSPFHDFIGRLADWDWPEQD